MRVKYRPRIVIKQNPEKLDRDEIGLVYNHSSSEFYACPPYLSSESLDILTARWMIYLRFLELVTNFEVDKMFFYYALQERALDQALSQFSSDGNSVRNNLVEKFRSCKRVLLYNIE
jgi:hypothetical protein